MDLNETRFMADEPGLCEQFSLMAGDVLMCRTNGTLAYVGISALVEMDAADTIFPDQVIRVQPSLDKIESQFLWRRIQEPAVRSQVEGTARPTVGNIAIGGRDIKARKVPLPTPEQQDDLSRALGNAVVCGKTKRVEVAIPRPSAWTTSKSALFTPAKPGSP